MDEQQQDAFSQLSEAMREIVVAFTTVLAPVVEAVGKVAAVFAEAYTHAQDAYHYEKATGLPYDPAKMVAGNLVPPLLLLPEHAESLVPPLLLPPVCAESLTERSAMLFIERERRVLALVREGKTNREIAMEMHVDITRIDVFVRRIKRKTGVRTKAELRLLPVRE